MKNTDDPGPAWFQWADRNQPLIAAGLVLACWIVSALLPMGWAS